MAENREYCESLIDKLTKNEGSTSILASPNELQEAYTETQNWKMSEFKKINEELPFLAILACLLEAIEKPFTSESVKRLEFMFGLLKGEATGGRVPNEPIMTDILTTTVEMLTKDQIEISLGQLRRCREEYVQYVDRFNALINLDSSATKVEEVMKDLAYLNCNHCKVLKGVIFPMMELAFQFNKESSLRDVFRETLAEMS